MPIEKQGKKYNYPRYSTCFEFELQWREEFWSNDVIWCTKVDSSFSTITIYVWRLGLLEDFEGMTSTLIFHPSRNFEKSRSENYELVIFHPPAKQKQAGKKITEDGMQKIVPEKSLIAE